MAKFKIITVLLVILVLPLAAASLNQSDSVKFPHRSDYYEMAEDKWGWLLLTRPRS